MEPTKPASSLKSFSHLSCGSLWGRISPGVTDMLVVSLTACTPQHIIRDCLALWQEHGRGDLTIPKQTLPSPISASLESSPSNLPCTCIPNCFLPGRGMVFQGTAETQEGAAPQLGDPQLDQELSSSASWSAELAQLTRNSLWQGQVAC